MTECPVCAYTREGEERSKRKIVKKLRSEYGYNERVTTHKLESWTMYECICGANIGVSSMNESLNSVEMKCVSPQLWKLFWNERELKNNSKSQSQLSFMN